MRSFRLFTSFSIAGLASAIVAHLLLSHVQDLRQVNAITAYADEIFRSTSSFVAGNPDGDVSVVEFFDYNCPYCRQGEPDVAKLVAHDGKVRLVLKELPVLGKDSEAVARVALAAIPQGKYLELHRKLLAERGRVNKDKALRIAANLGLDTARLEKDMHSPAVEAAIAANQDLTDRLGVDGVPFYLVGDRPLPEGGADLYAALTAGVADVRQHGCQAAC